MIKKIDRDYKGNLFGAEPLNNVDVYIIEDKVVTYDLLVSLLVDNGTILDFEEWSGDSIYESNTAAFDDYERECVYFTINRLVQNGDIIKTKVLDLH